MEVLYWPLSFIVTYVALFHSSIHIFAGERKDKNTGTVIMLVSVVVILFTSMVAPRNEVFYNLLYGIPPILLVVSVSMDIKRKRVVLAVISSYLMINIAAMIVATIAYPLSSNTMYDFHEYEAFNLMLEGITALLIFMAGMIADFLRRKRDTSVVADNTGSFVMFSLLCFIIGMAPVIITTQQLTGTHRYTTSIFGLVLFSFAFLLGTFVAQIIANRSIVFKSQMEMYRQFSEGQTAHYESLLSLSRQLRRIQHDMWAHFPYLQELISTGNYTEASQYLGELMAEARTPVDRRRTGNMVCDVVMGQLEAKTSVKFNLHGTLPPNLRIKDIDFCTILSNLLGNAAEAVRDSEMPIVEVHFKHVNTHLLIMVENHCEKPLRLKNGLPSSTKGDLHGLGIKKVKELVDQYGGNLKLCFEEKTFSAEVTLVDCIVEAAA